MSRQPPKPIFKVFRETAPLTPPVSQEFMRDFFDVFFSYEDGNNVLRMIYDVFGAEGAIKFISRFHGLALTIPERSYWENKFRDTHCYLVLRAISKQTDPEGWRQAVSRLARLYRMSTKNVMKIFRAVQATRKGGGL